MVLHPNCTYTKACPFLSCRRVLIWFWRTCRMCWESKALSLHRNCHDHSWGLIQSLKIECPSTLESSISCITQDIKTQGMLFAGVPQLCYMGKHRDKAHLPRAVSLSPWDHLTTNLRPLLPLGASGSNKSTFYDLWGKHSHQIKNMMVAHTQWIYFLILLP